MKFFSFDRVHSPLLPHFTYSVKSVVTNEPLGRVAHNDGQRGWVAHPTGSQRPMPGKFYTRRDAANALWHDLPK